MIKIHYFARLRDQLNCNNEQLEINSNGCLVSELKQQLALRGANWKQVMEQSNLLVAVNQVMANDQNLINSGDEVGFFPPVTGG